MGVHTVFLADESTTTRRVVELSFADPDVQVVAVRDGDEAIARLGEQPPDIILADISLPKRNGYDVAAYVKARPDLAHIPVVLLAGALDIVDESAVRASGCKSVLRKPFDPKQLSARVRDLLDGTAVDDLDQYFQQLDEAFLDLNARRVDEPSRVASSDDVEADVTLPESEAAEPIMVDAASVPTLEELLGEIDRSTEVFSLDALPADEMTATAAGPAEPATLPELAMADPARLSEPLAMDALVELVTDRVMQRLTEQLRLAADAVAAHLVAESAAPLIREEILKLRDQ